MVVVDFGQFGRQKDHLGAENGGIGSGTQQDLNKMVDMVKFGGQKDRPHWNGGGAKPQRIPNLTLKEGGSAHHPPNRVRWVHARKT